MSYANNITVAGQSTPIREILGAGGKMKKKQIFILRYLLNNQSKNNKILEINVS